MAMNFNVTRYEDTVFCYEDFTFHTWNNDALFNNLHGARFSDLIFFFYPYLLKVDPKGLIPFLLLKLDDYKLA